MRAGQSRYVDLNDEMDHLGLYIAQNNYSQHAADLMAEKFSKLRFDGFRTPIDEYFSAVAGGAPAPLPRQTRPSLLASIIGFLGKSTEPRRSELASFLLDAEGDFRDTFAAAIALALRENRELLRARPISIYGGMAMTLYVWSPSAQRLELLAEQHVRAVMVVNNEMSRRLVELEYSDDGVLVGAHMKYVSLAGFADAELKRIYYSALRPQ
jgi:hypothetical protein